MRIRPRWRPPRRRLRRRRRPPPQRHQPLRRPPRRLSAAAAAAAISAGRRRRGKKNWNFMKKMKNEKIAKNFEKIEKNYEKRRIWRSYAQTDVTIEFYAKNYPYRLIFKSVRLKIAENRFLASSDHPWQKNNCCLLKKTYH